MRYAGLFASLLLTACWTKPETKPTTIYATYGYEDAGQWRIPIRVWVHTPRQRTEEVLTHFAKSLGRLDEGEKARFSRRISAFVADSRSQQGIAVAFDPGPTQEVLRIKNERGEFAKTDLNGVIEGFIGLSKARATELLQRQGSRDGWLRVQVVSPGHTGAGRIRLMEARGRSVISDIDDTIKITEILAGAETVARNTFFRGFAAAPGMAGKYRALSDSGCTFHYVSGGPWQLYEPLVEFIEGEGGFPPGSFHMKSVPKNLLELSTWDDLAKLAQGDATFGQKVGQIGELLTRLPHRRFTLIGDSGERDPEVFREIKKRFGEQVEEIKIRDVAGDRLGRPERLAGMTIIAPETGEEVSR